MSKEIQVPKADDAARVAASAVAAQPSVPLEEPVAGGSYTRNPTTGALVKNEPAPTEEPSQE